MKNYTYLLLCSIILSSCQTYYPARTYTPSPINYHDDTRLMDIPTFAHDREIKVFFPGENPNKPYLKVFLLEEVAYGETSYANLVSRLKQQAQKKGVDAIIVLSRNRSETETEISYSVTNMASAVGIVYTENIEYEKEMPKQAIYSLYNYKTQAYEPADRYNLTPEGKVIFKKESTQYLIYSYNYSLDFMLHEKSRDWTYSSINEKKLIVKRTYKGTQYYTFKYNDDNQVTRVNVQKGDVRYEIDFYYKNGLLHKKEMYRDNKKRKLIRTDIFKYKSNGQLLSEEIFRLNKKNGIMIPFSKVDYDYYTKDDYKELIGKAVKK